MLRDIISDVMAGDPGALSAVAIVAIVLIGLALCIYMLVSGSKRPPVAMEQCGGCGHQVKPIQRLSNMWWGGRAVKLCPFCGSTDIVPSDSPRGRELAKKYGRATALATILLLLCAGCETARMNTASGRPEVTIHAELADVKAALESDLLDKGYLIMRTEGATVMGDKDMGLGAQMLIGSPSARPAQRVRFNVVELPGNAGVRAVGSVWITHAYFAQEADGNSNRTNVQLQYMLDCIKADLEHTPRPPAPELPPIEKAQSPREAASK